MRVQGAWFSVEGVAIPGQGAGCRVEVHGAGFRAEGAGLRVQGSGCRAGYRVQGAG